MTGFAQGRFNYGSFSLHVSFKSLNNRYLEISTRGSGISPITEKMIRETVNGRLFRGKVDIILDFLSQNQQKWDVQLNQGLLSAILEKVMPIKRKYKKHLTLSLDSLLKLPLVFHIDYRYENLPPQEIENIRSAIAAVFAQFLEDRKREGEAILADLKQHIGAIEDHLKKMALTEKKAEAELFTGYRKKIEKFANGMDIDDRRLMMEVAILSEKSAITEEITRLTIHTNRLQTLIVDETLPMKGKEADFLSQEMLRETHTVAAKTGSMEIHEHVICIRREIEKIKQQVQNVE
jgi:uncharacterized protein (TIGR00255 family)